VLALGYVFFLLAAGARSGVQIGTRFDHAPIAYVLSAIAAGVYAAGLAALLLAERQPARRRWAAWVGAAELGGVAGVGLLSLLRPAMFPDATVWSRFGAGYGYVPVALPLLSIGWGLGDRRGARGDAATGA
jgi:hypothetical protein